MDRVLGVSMTSAAVRLVLVDGTTGEGATIDRDIIDIATFQGAVAGDGGTAIDAADGDPPHVVGVTWTAAAEGAASLFLQSLAARGLDNVITVSTVEAATALAAGIADVAGYTSLAVCVVEPGEAVVATLGPDGVTVDRVDRSPDTAELIAMMDGGGQPEAIFVVGSADQLDETVASLEGAATSPVISAADADLALARGAALAAAAAVNSLDTQVAPARRRLPSRTATLTSVLAAAVVTFVVSLSVALGLRLVPNTDSQPGPQEVAKVADQPARAPAPPSAVPAVAPPPPPPEAPPPAPAPEVVPVSEPDPPLVAPVAPPPVYQPDPVPVAPPPAPEYVPPAPVYVPPPAPNYVPPPPPEPRLRDRIIERIPIFNRFHEPEYPTN